MGKFKIKEYEKRFKKAREVIKIPQPKNEASDPYILAYSAALHLLVRAKYLFLSTLAEANSRNTYASFVLVRSFFETCMALGYLSIKLEKKSKTGDIEGVWQLSHRILQGGKHFPEGEFLSEKKQKLVPAINVYSFIDEVDSNYQRIKGGEDPSTPHRKMYDTVLSEFGHPNHLGLVTCSWLERQPNGRDMQFVSLNKSYNKGDKNGCFINLNWGSVIFFHYWDKLVTLFVQYELDLPKLK